MTLIVEVPVPHQMRVILESTERRRLRQSSDSIKWKVVYSNDYRLALDSQHVRLDGEVSLVRFNRSSGPGAGYLRSVEQDRCGKRYRPGWAFCFTSMVLSSSQRNSISISISDHSLDLLPLRVLALNPKSQHAVFAFSDH